MNYEQGLQLVRIGQTVLTRYQHPEDWQEKFDRTQDRGRFLFGYSLIVDELNPEHVGVKTARIVERAIAAWAQSVQIPPNAIYTHILPPDVGYAPRIIVPKKGWGRVLAILQSLPKPQR